MPDKDLYFMVAAEGGKPVTLHGEVTRWGYGAHPPDGKLCICSGEFSEALAKRIEAAGGVRLTRDGAAKQSQAWWPADPTAGGTRMA